MAPRCSRSIQLLVQKSNRVQLKLSDCLAQAETAIGTLESVPRARTWTLFPLPEGLRGVERGREGLEMAMLCLKSPSNPRFPHVFHSFSYDFPLIFHVFFHSFPMI